MMLKNLYAAAIPALVILALASVILWTATDAKTVTVTEVINRVPDTQYCYTSEDGDWLICRLREN